MITSTGELEGSPRRSWEYPHPGQKFSTIGAVSSGASGHVQTVSSNTMGGVAAKAEMVHTDSKPLVRKSLRSRHRNTMPKPLKIPANVPEEAENKSASVCSPCSLALITPASPLQLSFLSMSERSRPVILEIDTDTETEVSISLDGTERDEVKGLETPPSFTDFSSFLDVSMIDEDYGGASITVVDSETYSNTQSSEDLYGWEAVLNRQLKCGITNSEVCHCDNYEYRRANGSKRGLLQRVFNSGRKQA